MKIRKGPAICESSQNSKQPLYGLL